MIKKLFVRKAEIILFFILIISIFLRFVNFPNRWQLSYDQARDTIVATYALNNHLIPLTGPFSSAGKFIYGPQWFWILYAYISIYKDFLLTPWIIHALIWSGMSFVMYLIGKEILGRKFGLLLSFFAAISWAQINIATNLISPSMAGIFSIISIYFFIRFIKFSGNRIDGFTSCRFNFWQKRYQKFFSFMSWIFYTLYSSYYF
jgi:hypothetical protein